MDAIEFFRQSEGEWRSQRTTHHLAFRQAEKGHSCIHVTALTADDPKVIEICQLHNVEPNLAIGGAHVTWDGEMAWDRETENHKGSTIFALVPDADNPRKGKLLRERGYAEIVPVVGEYEMDEEDALTLITEYETMSSVERFWFASPDVRMRTSTVKRFGGYNTSTFCTEVRVTPDTQTDSSAASPPQEVPFYSALGW